MIKFVISFSKTLLEFKVLPRSLGNSVHANSCRICYLSEIFVIGFKVNELKWIFFLTFNGWLMVESVYIKDYTCIVLVGWNRLISCVTSAASIMHCSYWEHICKAKFNGFYWQCIWNYSFFPNKLLCDTYVFLTALFRGKDLMHAQKFTYKTIYISKQMKGQGWCSG